MTTMLDKCAVAGDITQGIDRRGVWTAAITVIGGTSGTAVKLVSSDTVDGEYTDYKTLISASDAETDQYKGFVVDLHGAKKFIKVTGATMASAVFGDCDHDVKNIAITAGEVPSGADLENNHEVTITENGVVEITPSEGKDGMKKVTATINVSGGGGDVPTEWYLWQDDGGYYSYLSFETAPDTLDSLKLIDVGDTSVKADTEVKTFGVTDYTKNSDTEFTLTDVNGDTYTYTRITEDVPISGGANLEDNKTATIDVSTYTEPVEITPTRGKDGMKKATITLSNIPSSFFDTITLNIDNPIYSKTLTKGATVHMNNKYVNMLVGRGDVTETITSIGEVFATVNYIDSTRVLTATLNNSHPEASEGASFNVWGE